jgi:integrase
MTMQDQENATVAHHNRVPWNKGKVTGSKPPLRPKHVWSIRTKLQIEGRARDLAMFNLAIDSKLRGCDVVAIKVEDIAASGYAADRATVRQKKTGRPVRFELSEQTRQAVDDYLKVTNKRPGEFLFTGRRGAERSMTTRQYARLVSKWIGSVGRHYSHCGDKFSFLKSGSKPSERHSFAAVACLGARSAEFFVGDLDALAFCLVATKTFRSCGSCQ